MNRSLRRPGGDRNTMVKDGMRKSPFLFVYGTLRRGVASEWSHFLASNAQPVGTGKTAGILFQLDGYPGMVPAPNGRHRLVGEVYQIDDPAHTWAELDRYEGEEFERQIVSVKLDDGRKLDAWAYVYKADTADKPRIASGDYLTTLNR
jgi:gamma-glutamylcyclotransferase (GGCT)/AIG2-like uncharacterized protein YtfP